MRYWLTTHYPHPQPDDHPWHVYLQAQFKDIAEKFQVGDRVLFYEVKHHRPVDDGRKYGPGAEGIRIVGTVEKKKYEQRPPQKAIVEYAEGKRYNWLWGVPTRRDEEGFVSRKELCRLLGYKTNYYLRGFGLRRSGVRELTEEEFNELLSTFRQRRS